MPAERNVFYLATRADWCCNQSNEHFKPPCNHILTRPPTATRWKTVHCTAGDDGSVGIISCMSIFSACFGLLTSRQLAATTWSGQIWISCWILPHFDVRTISVAWKLKKLSNIFWQKIFFLLNPPSKGLAQCALQRDPAGSARQLRPGDQQLLLRAGQRGVQVHDEAGRHRPAAAHQQGAAATRANCTEKWVSFLQLNEID